MMDSANDLIKTAINDFASLPPEQLGSGRMHTVSAGNTHVTLSDFNPSAGTNTLAIEGEEVVIHQERLQVGVNMQLAQDSFEQRFGVDQIARTKKQWQNLVDQYGMETVVKMEGMSKRAVKDKCK